MSSSPRERLSLLALAVTSLGALALATSACRGVDRAPELPPPSAAADGGLALDPPAERSGLAPAPTPKARAARPATPSCTGRVVGTELHVDAGPTPIVVADDVRDLADQEVRTFPHGEGRVLVALAPPWFVARGAHPNGLLWEVPCDAPEAAGVFVSRPGADFGHAVLSSDRWTLIFSDEDGLAALDLESRSVGLLTEAPEAPAGCWERDRAITLRDVPMVLATGDTRLTFHRGGPCGYEGDWVAREHVLTAPLDPALRATGAPHPIAALAASESTLWLADGGRCDEPGIVDPATRGAILRSDDEGETWTRVPITPVDDPMRTHAARILLGRGDPDHMLVHAATCRIAGGPVGGGLYLSTDGGAEWRALPLPEGAERVVAFVSMNGRHDTIIAWLDEERRFATHDAGETWTALDRRPVPRVPHLEPVATAAYSYFPGTDGLSRSSGPGTTPRRIYPTALE